MLERDTENEIRSTHGSGRKIDGVLITPHPFEAVSDALTARCALCGKARLTSIHTVKGTGK